MSTTGGFKDRLMDTLRGAVANFNESGDPNAAVVKAARDNEFNPEQTSRLVEAFNTARTLYHYKAASDRTANFALADAGTVLADLFERPDACIAKAAASADYSEYDRRELDYNDDTPAEKVAETETDSGLSLDALAMQAMKAVRGLRQTVKIAEDEARLACVRASMCLTKLADMFSRGCDRDALQSQYARLVLGYAKQAEWAPVLGNLAAFTPAQNRASDAVMRKCAYAAVIDDTDLGPHIALMKEAREAMEVEAELLAEAGVLGKEADAFEREWLELVRPGITEERGDTLANFINPAVVKAAQTVATQKYKTRNLYGEPVDVESKSDSGSPGQPGITDSITGLMGDPLRKALGGQLETGVTRLTTEPLARENKALSEKLKNVQRQIMLQDLMTNDPVLSEESPETVAQAYSAIMQMAPEMSGNKEVVRAVLRQTVHSVAVSPYDAEIWTKLEKNLMNVRGKAPMAREDR